MLSRRDLLARGARVTGALAAGRLVPATAPAAPVAEATFAHGVASGDPTPGSVVLWTRVSGVDGDAGVAWTVAREESLTEVVARGEATATAEADHTVHVDVGGLAPATTYFYAFDHGGVRSPVGRTRTARGPDDLAEVRVGVVACSSFAAGPFTAYGHLARADVDLVVHLGDYLYEHDSGPREHDPPDEPFTLADYRRRHAQQRSDPDLRRLHAAAPMAAIWDDHDVAQDAHRSGSKHHDPDEHGPWEDRRTAALRAWVEWLPVRLPDPAQPDRIWRTLPLGGVADLVLLDTRHDGRDPQVSPRDADAPSALADPSRSMLSEAQRTWVVDQLASSRAAWRVLANQVVLTPLGYEVPAAFTGATERLGLTVDGKVVNPDAWDGYPAERARLLAAVAAAGPTLVLTGDVHSSWALEVPGPDGDVVTVEWVAPSVTAEPFADIVRLPSPALAPAAVDVIQTDLPRIRWAELTRHGFLVVALLAERAQCDWWHVDLEAGDAEVAASWSVTTGVPSLAEAVPLGERLEAVPPRPAPAPSTVDDVAPGAGGTSRPATVAGLAAATAALAAGIAVRRRRGTSARQDGRG